AVMRGLLQWKGLAVANHRAMPVAMMNAPSVTPTPRKNRVCSRGISSGWRADASRNLEVAMPIPRQEPRAENAIIRATARGRNSVVGMAWLRRDTRLLRSQCGCRRAQDQLPGG